MRIMYKLSLQFDTRWHDINIARRCNRHKFCVNCRQCTLRSRDVTNFACVLDPTQLLISPYIKGDSMLHSKCLTRVNMVNYTSKWHQLHKFYMSIATKVLCIDQTDLHTTNTQTTNDVKIQGFFLNWNDQQHLFQSSPYSTFRGMASFETKRRNNVY